MSLAVDLGLRFTFRHVELGLGIRVLGSGLRFDEFYWKHKNKHSLIQILTTINKNLATEWNLLNSLKVKTCNIAISTIQVVYGFRVQGLRVYVLGFSV